MEQEKLIELLKKAKSALYFYNVQKCNFDCDVRKEEAFELAEQINKALKEWENG